MSFTQSDWMRGIGGDKNIADIFIPGSHDSSTARVFFPLIARCQSTTISDQLSAGCRFFDLRLTVRDGRLFAVHGRAPCYSPEKKGRTPLDAREIFDAIAAFLRRNPSETVLAAIKQEGRPNAGFRKILYDYISDYEFYSKNELPSLDEVRGRIVLLRRFDAPEKNGDLIGGINVYDTWSSEHPAPGDSRTAAVLGCERGEPRAPFCLQDEFTYGVKKKWEQAVKPMIDRGSQPGELFLNYLSCTGRLSPKAAAVPLNKKFLAEPTLRGGGIYIFDYFTPELAKKVYGFNTDLYL